MRAVNVVAIMNADDDDVHNDYVGRANDNDVGSCSGNTNDDDNDVMLVDICRSVQRYNFQSQG